MSSLLSLSVWQLYVTQNSTAMASTLFKVDQAPKIPSSFNVFMRVHLVLTFLYACKSITMNVLPFLRKWAVGSPRDNKRLHLCVHGGSICLRSGQHGLSEMAGGCHASASMCFSHIVVSILSLLIMTVYNTWYLLLRHLRLLTIH